MFGLYKQSLALAARGRTNQRIPQYSQVEWHGKMVWVLCGIAAEVSIINQFSSLNLDALDMVCVLIRLDILVLDGVQFGMV